MVLKNIVKFRASVVYKRVMIFKVYIQLIKSLICLYRLKGAQNKI